MNTRVSWIDPNHIQSLLARLGPQESESLPPNESCEIDTLSDQSAFMCEAAPTTAPSEVHFFEPLSAPVEPPVEPPAPPPPLEEEPTAPAPTAQMVEPAPEVDDVMLPLDRIRERLRIIRHRAAEAGMLSSPTVAHAVEVEPDFTTSIAAFANTESQHLPQGFTLIICDDQGGVLWSNDSKPGLTLSALMAHRSARYSSSAAILPASAVVHHSLPADQILSIFSCTSRSGNLQIAIKGSNSIEDKLVDSWRNTISKL